ncbi:ABC-2 type transport system permease protein [Bacillus ectoiniformans]|uniref:ABC transporter permease n=1 Tax=Bacillus ectoiniformans TaxID=1494429 RepID=UPI00195EF40E|nr:ABC transporter permease [Bacillus ectoiniformans]MBM7647620.1 ABC-2 type transport system permease protein [Bacillus ectoiniformans]
MNSFWIMLSQAYINKFKTKVFLLTTIIVSLSILLMANFEQVISMFDKEEEKTKIAVIDESGILYDPLKQQMAVIDKGVEIVKTDQSENDLKDAVEEGEFNGYLLLNQTEEELPAGTYKADTVANSRLVADLQLALQNIKTAEAAKQFNLTPEQIALWNTPVDFQKIALAKNAKSEEEIMQAQALVYVLLFFIYISVITYSNMIAAEVAIEKSSRVMEILISSVSPVKQMFAKILGIGLLGMTQMTVWLSVAYLANSGKSEDSLLTAFGLTNVAPSMIVYAVIFFILGYFLYATIAALLGSLVSRLEDVQQMMMPLTFLVMIGFFISMFGLGNPESSVITFTSYVPFFTPMIMFVRIGMLDISIIEISLGIAILAASIIGFALIGARVYKGGVLMYGKSNSLKDIKKALQLSKNEK